MRKILFSIAIIVLLILTILVVYRGTDFLGLNVFGIKQISEENNKIDNEIGKLSQLIEFDYPATLNKLNTSSATLERTKKEYEEQAILLANSKYYKQSEKYKVEFLWTKIGNYAKRNNTVINLKFKNSVVNGLYDIDIEAIGKYSNVAQFIYDIENDSRLGFKIEVFSMKESGVASSEGGESSVTGVVANFTVKEIKIDMKSLDGGATQSSSNQQNTANEATDTPTTNNTVNSNTTDNTTNADNTTTTNNNNTDTNTANNAV